VYVLTISIGFFSDEVRVLRGYGGTEDVDLGLKLPPEPLSAELCLKGLSLVVLVGFLGEEELALDCF